jgi:hypothetical protein
MFRNWMWNVRRTVQIKCCFSDSKNIKWIQYLTSLIARWLTPLSKINYIRTLSVSVLIYKWVSISVWTYFMNEMLCGSPNVCGTWKLLLLYCTGCHTSTFQYYGGGHNVGRSKQKVYMNMFLFRTVFNIKLIHSKTQLRGLSPRMNYTDCVATACRQS